MAPPQPEEEELEALEVAALEVVEDWAAARPATAKMRAVVYCILLSC